MSRFSTPESMAGVRVDQKLQNLKFLDEFDAISIDDREISLDEKSRRSHMLNKVKSAY